MRTDQWRESGNLNPLPTGGRGKAEARGNGHGFAASAPIAAREPKRGVLRAARLLLRRLVMRAWRFYYVRGLGMEIDQRAWFSLRVHLDRTHPRGIHIGRDSYIAFGAVVLTHDMTRGVYADTRIGERCFIGSHSLILPGVTIGDGAIVGAGSVVTRNVPPATIVAGNPARVIRTGIKTYRFGCLWDWEAHGARQPRGP